MAYLSPCKSDNGFLDEGWRGMKAGVNLKPLTPKLHPQIWRLEDFFFLIFLNFFVTNQLQWKTEKTGIEFFQQIVETATDEPTTWLRP